ncbi:MAG: GDCCVxC domain-containing (seleno)protein [Alphaproteobacteria bacterium]
MSDRPSTLACPECGHKATEEIPRDSCQYFYDCTGCRIVLKPLSGDFCVYCSYKTVP